MGGIPIPDPCFLDECEPIGAPDGRKRWRSMDKKRLFTWDSLHGEIEVYNKLGYHLGVLNVEGILIKSEKKGTTINV